MGISKFNHSGRKFKFQTPESHTYKSLAMLYAEYSDNPERVTVVRALYINHKSKYGDSPCMVTDFEIVNLPKHMTDDVKAIIADDSIVDDINSGRVGFKIAPYEKDNKTYYSIDWVEIPNGI